MKIVIANCVGIDSDGHTIIPYPSRWTTSARNHKDAFTYYPKDLGYLSTLLKRDTGHDVKLVDACLERYDKETYAKVITSEKPDWLIMESSTRTITDDLWVARKVKEVCGAKIMMTGQHPSAFAQETLKNCDVVIRGEFLAPALKFFKNGVGQTGVVIEFDKSSLIDVKDLPYPEDEDVSRFDYALKGDPICQYKEIQLYTSRGCPYRCIYCVASHTYYGGPDWRPRSEDDVVEEMRQLFQKYPDCEGIFFDDEIHNADIKRIKRLCKAIIAAGLNDKKYNAMCAYHTFDHEALTLMKEAGYYLVRVGIETASDEVARGLWLKGKHRPAKLRAFLEMAKEIGIEVYGTFTMGGPGSNEVEDRKTIWLMKELIEENYISDCQVSICVPQPGAPFFDIVSQSGDISGRSWSDYDGGTTGVVDYPGYSAKRIKEIRDEAMTAYDEARYIRDRVRFKSNWADEVSKITKEPHGILLFRSSRDWHLALVLNAIKESWPMARVSMLCHENHTAVYSKDFPWLDLIVYRSDGFINIDSLNDDALSKMKSMSADVAFIPSNIYHCRGYSNVTEVAQKSGATRLFFINSAGVIIPVDDLYGK
ncbi:hypothetical protein MNBD_NITROSPINAE02-1812 [hydrothermal vent metagenome]|uniref:Radical SAM core domain-containing protein n=1 Tax=hydrothermal vent metagenome TaxID=652676 RepID=A0A3B1CKJ7_9ZZZZ